MRVTEYQLIERKTVDDVAAAMRECISLGWQPLGGPVVAQEYEKCGGRATSSPTYLQGVIKVEEEHNELERLRGIEAQMKMLLGDIGGMRGVISDDDMISHVVAAVKMAVEVGE